MGFINDLLGTGESREPNIQTITPPTPQIPGMAEGNQVAQARFAAGNPWTLGPHRAMDYLHNYSMAPNHVPQFNPAQGINTQSHVPGNNNMLMGNWNQPHPGLMQPQYSPIAWAMQLGQLFSQLAPLYQQSMGMQQGQNPAQGVQQQQPQQGGGQA